MAARRSLPVGLVLSVNVSDMFSSAHLSCPRWSHACVGAAGAIRGKIAVAKCPLPASPRSAARSAGTADAGTSHSGHDACSALQTQRRHHTNRCLVSGICCGGSTDDVKCKHRAPRCRNQQKQHSAPGLISTLKRHPLPPPVGMLE